MKRLTIKTIRNFTDKQYEDYKQLGLFDFSKLEKEKSYDILTHKPGENVITTITLEDL